MKDYYVYILLCADGSYYTGVTNDYERRVAEHQSGSDPKSYTHRRRPVKLVYVGIFGDINEAISWEKRVKGWTRRKKEALIRRDFEALPSLSQCTNGSHYQLFKAIACHSERSRRATCDLLCHPSTTLRMTKEIAQDDI
ncbi:MAG: GIY-YIG nuclease family protein [Candidatus Peregrinibacteria bacterium]